MSIMQKKKVRLKKYVTTRKNYDSILVIYLTDAEGAQCRLVDENRREKEEVKKESAKKIDAPKLCLQQNRSEGFHRCQDFM